VGNHTAIPESVPKLCHRGAARRRHPPPSGAGTPSHHDHAGLVARLLHMLRASPPALRPRRCVGRASLPRSPKIRTTHVRTSRLAMIATERPDGAGGPDAVAGHLARARQHLHTGVTKTVVTSRPSQRGAKRETRRAPTLSSTISTGYRTTQSHCSCSRRPLRSQGPATPCRTRGIRRAIHQRARRGRRGISLARLRPTEQGLWYDAADLADAALELDPGNGNAAHALSHVHYETDAHGAGLKCWKTGSATAARSVTSHTFSGTPRCTSSRWATDCRSTPVRRISRAAPFEGRALPRDAGSLAWRARLHPDWVTPPDPMPVLAESARLRMRRKHRLSRSTRCSCWQRRMIGRDPRDKCSGRDRHAGNYVASLNWRRSYCLDKRRAARRTRLPLESLAGLPSIAAAVCNKKWFSNRVGRDAPTRCAGSSSAPLVAISRYARAASEPRRRELTR